MLLDFTEGTATALYQERPRRLIIRIADHPSYEGFVAVGLQWEHPTCEVAEEVSFGDFMVCDYAIIARYVASRETPIHVQTAYTDGTTFGVASYHLVVTREGDNGWWIQVRRRATHQTYFPDDNVFRLPLVDFDPAFTEDEVASAEVRAPDWERLAADPDPDE